MPFLRLQYTSILLLWLYTTITTYYSCYCYLYPLLCTKLSINSYFKLFKLKVDSSNYGNYSSIIEQIFNMKNNLDQFNVLRKVKGESKTNQRKLAKELNFSLGKLNYCLKALKVKGLIKINSFISVVIIPYQ